jgi:hypothetical protein
MARPVQAHQVRSICAGVPGLRYVPLLSGVASCGERSMPVTVVSALCR